MRDKLITAFGLLSLFAAMLIIGFAIGAQAHADEPGCIHQPWWRGEAMRWTQRIICDGPIQSDGSWVRAREFYGPRYYVPMRCSWSAYGGGCSGDYWVPEYDSGVETYIVRPETVLPDEPGHIA